MKIVFTAKGGDWDSSMDARFGRMEMLVTYDEDSDKLEAITNSETEDMEHGAGLQTAQKVLDLNPDVIITGNGAGEKALKILKTSSAKIYIGAGDMSLKEAYEAYKNEQLLKQL
ncbi:MAG TPA: dinitrogenase iron-molybdenum cofactor biosynthesis protein [Sulfurospirillum arcachonense]|nr:dinitrogenase iron-molybdenum cofactor biosynthesis protein [Sulfurospirillum arcachonense]HIP45712.1 dinitrogenase iron-molybdenum cofactor biosynthesis protein [Sulfurospirillum arcachonense]